MPNKKLRCSSCSSRLIAWGKTSSGKQRFYCSACGTSRILKNQKGKKNDQLFQLFRHYVLWGDTYEQLASLSGYSIGHLSRMFHVFLHKDTPVLPPLDQSQVEFAYLLIDGLWFGRWFVLMVYRQSKNLTILHIAVAGKEVATKVVKDLRTLLSYGYRFTGIVSDGGTGIKKAVWEVFPHVPHQICLAHTHRDIVNSLGRHPKDWRVKQLKRLADHLWLIESQEALNWWKQQLKSWYRKHWRFLLERRIDQDDHWWYIHKGVRKAVRIMTSAPDFCFTFLSHPLMPKTTNELEAQFGHLGKRWLVHRGLKKDRWEKFMQWFVYFYNLEKLSSRKQKKD